MPITIPFGAKMIFNSLKRRPATSLDEVELALGELCTDSKQLGYEMLWQGVPE